MHEYSSQPYLAEVKNSFECLEKIESDMEYIMNHGVDKIAFIGSGGSLALMKPLMYFIERYSSIQAEAYYASEFVYTGLDAINEKTLCVFSSKSGDTPETVMAARLCSEKTELTAAFLTLEKTPLSRHCSFSWIAMSDAAFSEAFLVKGYIFLANVLRYHARKAFCYTSFIEQLRLMPDLLVEVKRNSWNTMEQFGEKNKSVAYHMIVAAGALWGLAYSNAMCVWEERFWVYGKAVHAGEFFHGALEAVSPSTSIVLLKGEDETRPLADKVEQFGKRVTEELFVVDTKDCELPGIRAEYREYMSVLAMNAMLEMLEDGVYKSRLNAGVL